MILNENMCLAKTFEMVRFKIKIMGLWDKRDLKWYFTVAEWSLSFIVTFYYRKTFGIKHLEWQANKYFDHFPK